jgi:hypothetical protein
MTRAYNTATTQQNSGGAVPAFLAGKNKLINGDFLINQRNFTSSTTSATFVADRWQQSNVGGTYTVSREAFTLGAAPVAGYEGKTFIQAITASQSAAGDLAYIGQNIEDVRTFAGQTVTLSFWAKANTGTPKVAVSLGQIFGTGGSPSASATAYVGQVTLSTSWARYSLTYAMPSISGKTIGTNNNDYVQLALWTSAGSNYNSLTGSLGIQNFTASLWGVQLEAGSVATPFTTATGTIQGELALCQRYFQRYGTGLATTYILASGLTRFGDGAVFGGTAAHTQLTIPWMRTSPTMSTTGSWRGWTNNNHDQPGSLSIQYADFRSLNIRFEKSSGTWSNDTAYIHSPDGGFVNLSAEL